LLRLGTSSWTAKGWEEVFYPPAIRDADRIAHYASHFPTVEVDATFYRIPSAAMVRNWAAKTPDGFVFAAKVPQTITHEKVLEHCEADMAAFLNAMGLLGPKLGPLLLQFGYFNKSSGVTRDVFLSRLDRFLATLPLKEVRFAVEIRNKAWFGGAYLDLLRTHGVCAALIDQSWMPPVEEQLRQGNVFTADFLYVRWLGDRKGIEEMTKTWTTRVIDRTEQMRAWVPPIKDALDRQMDVFGYVNNHYSGYAPADVQSFHEMLSAGQG
jgi:uncharacterized protein YecE (DUF72 family)